MRPDWVKTDGRNAFDVPTQNWLKRLESVIDPVADAVRCPACARGVRPPGTAEDLARSCRNMRTFSALPCPMAVNHKGAA